jgi:hypothetical protein
MGHPSLPWSTHRCPAGVASPSWHIGATPTAETTTPGGRAATPRLPNPPGLRRRHRRPHRRAFRRDTTGSQPLPLSASRASSTHSTGRGSVVHHTHPGCHSTPLSPTRSVPRRYPHAGFTRLSPPRFGPGTFNDPRPLRREDTQPSRPQRVGGDAVPDGDPASAPHLGTTTSEPLVVTNNYRHQTRYPRCPFEAQTFGAAHKARPNTRTSTS